METEQSPPASSASTTSTTSTTSTSTTSASSTSTSTGTSTSSASSTTASTARQTVPQISVYSGIPDRQTVQVIQQALHRQPSTAAQYLQQMYAAQQQHLMLHTAALQQQHLSSAQLQSLAAVQQASIAAGRQGSNQNGTSAQQTGSSQTTINLTTPPAAAQLISRAQSVSSAPAGISQQAVLLGNPSSPALTASQAQMYLRAQMLIFTPTATVTTVQPEASAQSAGQQSVTAQVQNLAIRGQQGAAASPSQAQLQGLSLKQAPLSIQPTALLKSPAQGGPGGLGAQGAGAKAAPPEASPDGGKKAENAAGGVEARVVNMSRTAAVNSHPLIAPAYAQIQPHQLLQPQKQQNFVIQQQPQTGPRAQTPLLQPAPLQASAGTPPVPVLPKPPVPSQQATIFHSTVSPLALGHHSQPPASLSQPKVQPVQLTAINLQIQPPASAAARLVQDSISKDSKPASSVVKESPPTPSTPQPTSVPPQRTSTDQQASDSSKTPPQQQGTGGADRDSSGAVSGTPPAMTSGNENDAPSVTGSTPQNGESKPPQAIVKPQVLTHVIEGFVIQEGAEPFPVERAPLLVDGLKKQSQQQPSDPEKTPQSNPPNTTDSETEDLTQQELRDQEEVEEPKLQCEFCGWVDFAYNFKGTKRFCSTVCAKRYNVGCSKRIGLFHPDRSKTTSRWRRRPRSGGRQNTEAKKPKRAAPQPSLGGSVSSPLPSQPSQGESSPCSDMSSFEGPPSPLSAASSGPPAPQGQCGADQDGAPPRELPALSRHFLPSDPTKWSVEEVHGFIRSLPGCQEIAEEFRLQEIDGQALLLLKEDHLMSAMNIKLGPALKIYAHISMLKDP
ncbi:polyhomeotic-like protein 2b isoform X2 [Megalops cyprinoides]|uniref:polyhomeotic-like protein 2b isoform X2 n=1 Tax=Megalops cyprinoides TaxID=118141 RepID=UPI0018646A21|nr:polyhomeotic-like protein 2b isoform X2 [Megalops cyprinoides]